LNAEKNESLEGVCDAGKARKSSNKGTSSIGERPLFYVECDGKLEGSRTEKEKDCLRKRTDRS